MQNKYSKIVIGLVGGIASGKSTIARLFKETGKGKVIDADKIGYHILNTPYVRKRLVTYYGGKVLTNSGRVNRRYLADVCFRNRKNITILNNLVHPFIRKEIFYQIQNIRRGIIILDAALLLEKGLNRICDYVVFVNTPYKTRLQRVLNERNWPEDSLKQREMFQMPLRIKKNKSDFIIHNRNNLTYARRQVIQILRKILKGE